MIIITACPRNLIYVDYCAYHARATPCHPFGDCDALYFISLFVGLCFGCVPDSTLVLSRGENEK